MLFGLGLGMFLASVAVMLQGPKELSREEIERRAERLGMGYREQFLIFPAEENRHTSVDPNNHAVSQEPTQAPPINKGVASLEVVINQGSTLAEAARILYEAGLVEEPGIFVQKVQQMGLSQYLRAGTYRLSPGIDLEELVRQVTRPPRQKPPVQVEQQ
ncbi:MAG: hypothetical protein ACOY9Y_06245 [Bacillota bacterium]